MNTLIRIFIHFCFKTGRKFIFFISAAIEGVTAYAKARIRQNFELSLKCDVISLVTDYLILFARSLFHRKQLPRGAAAGLYMLVRIVSQFINCFGE